MKRAALFALLPLAVFLGFHRFPNQLPDDYQEECLSEGCSSEEVKELYASYYEECIGEGCSKEEIYELAGSPQAADQMCRDFAQRGFQVRPQDCAGLNPTCTGTTTSCYGVVLVCDDHCTFPDGSKRPPYACGACLGLSGCSSPKRSSSLTKEPLWADTHLLDRKSRGQSCP